MKLDILTRVAKIHSLSYRKRHRKTKDIRHKKQSDGGKHIQARGDTSNKTLHNKVNTEAPINHDKPYYHQLDKT